MEKSKMNAEALLTAILIYACYFIYTIVFTQVFSILGIKDDIILMFISDLLFFFGIVYVYKDCLKKDFLDFIHQNSCLKKVWFVVKWVIILFVVNMLGGMLTELLAPSLAVDDGNTTAIYSLASVSTIYTIFKSMVFGVVAEELVFKKAIRDVIPNHNGLFIVVSGLVYALMNIAYTDISVGTLVPFCSYFIFSGVLSYIYVKNNNIVMVMLVKLFYNLIPLTILLLGLGA